MLFCLHIWIDSDVVPIVSKHTGNAFVRYSTEVKETGVVGRCLYLCMIQFKLKFCLIELGIQVLDLKCVAVQVCTC